MDVWCLCVCAFFCVCVCDELLTHPRNPTGCLRSSRLKWNGEFHGGRPRPDLICSAKGKKTRTQQNRCLQSPHLRTETNPVSETLCSLVFLEYRTMDKIQKSINPYSTCLFLIGHWFRKALLITDISC
jgi:hypothetical protein